MNLSLGWSDAISGTSIASGTVKKLAATTESHAWMGIGRQRFQQFERVGDPIAQVTQHSCRGRPPQIFRGEYLLQQRHVDHVVILMQPERFEPMMLELGI